jgi:hypothetical protein
MRIFYCEVCQARLSPEDVPLGSEPYDDTRTIHFCEKHRPKIGSNSRNKAAGKGSSNPALKALAAKVASNPTLKAVGGKAGSNPALKAMNRGGSNTSLKALDAPETVQPGKGSPKSNAQLRAMGTPSSGNRKSPAGGNPIRGAQHASGIRSAQPGSGIRAAQPGSGIRNAQPGSGIRAAQPGSGIRTSPVGKDGGQQKAAGSPRRAKRGSGNDSSFLIWTVAGIVLLGVALILLAPGKKPEAKNQPQPAPPPANSGPETSLK